MSGLLLLLVVALATAALVALFHLTDRIEREDDDE